MFENLPLPMSRVAAVLIVVVLYIASGGYITWVHTHSILMVVGAFTVEIWGGGTVAVIITEIVRKIKKHKA